MNCDTKVSTRYISLGIYRIIISLVCVAYYHLYILLFSWHVHRNTIRQNWFSFAHIGSDVGGGVLNQGHRFVSFVRAYARSGCLVTLNLNLCWWSFSLFSFGFGELSLSRVILRSFHFSLPPPPKPPIQLQFGLSVKNICEFSASTHAHATGRHYTTIQRSGVDACEKGLRWATPAQHGPHAFRNSQDWCFKMYNSNDTDGEHS